MRKKVFSQAEIQQILLPVLREKGLVFKKFKTVFAKLALGGELIETHTSDGLETVNSAKPGDFIVQNRTNAGEQYSIPAEKFAQRYQLKSEMPDGAHEYEPTGKTIGLELSAQLLESLGLPDHFYFIANWGEEMVAKQGDFCCAPLDFSEIYRIARQEFFETYKSD